MRKISVTLFDTFQSYLDSEKDAVKFWRDDDDFEAKLLTLESERKQALIHSLNGVYTSNEAMQKGTLFHTLVLEPYKQPENTFNFDLNFIQEFRSQIPEGILVEVSERREKFGFLISGKADFLHTSHIGELKTTSKYEFERYEKSWQWRWYLWLFGMDCLTYYVTELKPDNPIIGKVIAPFSFYYYPELEAELNLISLQLDHFLDANKHLLK